MNNTKEEFYYNKGYVDGYREGMNTALEQLIKQEQLRTSITVYVSANDLDKVTETERELADALNTVENYKNMLFGK